MKALIPKGGEDEQTRINKLSRLHSFMNTLVKTPTLDGSYIPYNRFKQTNVNAIKNAYMPGTVVNGAGGKKLKIGPDGVTPEAL